MTLLAGVRQRHSLEGGMVLDERRGVPVWNPPQVLAGLHVDRGNRAVWRFPDRQPLRTCQITAIGNDPSRQRLACRLRVVWLVHLRSRDDVFRAAGTFTADVQDSRLRIGHRWSVDIARTRRTTHE